MTADLVARLEALSGALGHVSDEYTAKTIREAASALRSSGEAVEDEALLVEFFRGDSYQRFGWKGDSDGKTPGQAAVEAMRELLRVESDLRSINTNFDAMGMAGHKLLTQGVKDAMTEYWFRDPPESPMRQSSAHVRTSGLSQLAKRWDDELAVIYRREANAFRQCAYELRAEIPHLHSATPTSAWRPIAEAPRDGTRVLLHVEGVDRPVLGQWNGSEWATLDANDWSGRNLLSWSALPPLPTPPISTKGG